MVQKDLTDTVIYNPIGHIVPVNPEGNRIPGVPTKPYINDPDNPTKVIPNETVPTIPGMIPSQNEITPANPTTNTPVIYYEPVKNNSSTPVKTGVPGTAPVVNADHNPSTPAMTNVVANQTATSRPQVTTVTSPSSSTVPQKLPQTGNQSDKSTTVLGLAALGLTGMLAFGKKRKKKD